MISLALLTVAVLLVALALGYLANRVDEQPRLPPGLDFSREFQINENGPGDADTSRGPTARR